MVCPVCTVAVGAGVGILREIGVDDVLTGIWFGALIVSSIIWFISWLDKKNVHFLFRKILVIIVFYAVFILPLYPLGVLGVGNSLFGIEKLLFGVFLGTVLFLLAVGADAYLRKINENQPVVAYQKVLVPLVILIISTVIAYLLMGIAGV